jgi:Leucine-rich repeat (LRR) protein
LKGFYLAYIGEMTTLPAGLFSQMADLETIQIQYNKFTGPLPSLQGLKKIREVTFANNLFSGELPAWLTTLTTLEVLEIQANQFSGTLPTDIGKLTKLIRLQGWGNLFTGEIPASVGDLSELRVLDLGSCQLSGRIPESVGRLAKLNTLALAENKLTGEIPASIGDLTNLEGLYLYSNQLTGTIPSGITRLTHLGDLYLAMNQLSGTLPSSIGDMTALGRLVIYENQLRGPIPDSIGDLANLTRFSANGNLLEGSIPSSIGRLNKLDSLELATNRLTGAIPVAIGQLPALTTLDLNANQLTGQIPDEIGNISTLNVLNLGGNRLTGTIPKALGKLTKLWVLYLYYNRLFGEIPAEIGDMTELRYLNLASNMLSGPVPSSITRLSKMEMWGLNLRYNALYVTDAAVRAYLEERAADSEDTQTLPPISPTVGVVSTTSVTVRWNPILYQSHPGGYEVLVATRAIGPYTRALLVPGKLISSATITGLTAGTSYFVRVRTYTLAHEYNQNLVYSDPSDPATPATTSAPGSVVVKLSPDTQRIVVGRTAPVTVTLEPVQNSDVVVTLSLANTSIASLDPAATSVTVPAGRASVNVSVRANGPGTTYLRAVLPANLGGTSAAADLILTYDECDRPGTPAFTNRSTGVSVRAGSAFTLNWTEVLSSPDSVAGSSGTYQLDLYGNATCTGTRRRFSTPSASLAVTTEMTDQGTWCAIVRAISPTNCAGGDSEPITITIRPSPPFFAVVRADKTQEPFVLGSVPEDGKVQIKNIGSSATSLTFSSKLATFRPEPASLSQVAAGQTSEVTLVFDPLVTTTPATLFDSLCATWSEGSDSRQVCLPVLRTALGTAPVITPTASVRLSAEPSNEVHFISPAGANPPTQQVTIRNNGDVKTRVVPAIGPGGAWLSIVSGDLVTELQPGEARTFLLAADRSRRGVNEPAPASTSLAFVGVDGKGDKPKVVFQVYDEEPAAVTTGTRRDVLGASDSSLIIPAGVSASGRGTFFISDGWVRNAGGTAVQASLYYTPDGADGLIHPQVRSTQITLQPYATYRLADFIRGLFSTSGSGAVEIRSSGIGNLAVRSTVDSLTFKPGRGVSRFGAEIPVIRSRQGARLTSAGATSIVLTGLRGGEGAASRSNIILAETSGRSVTVSLKFVSKDGEVLKESTQTVLGYSKLQINDGDGSLFPAGVTYEGASLEVTPMEGLGSVVAFSTVIDNASQGYTIRTGKLVAPEGSAERIQGKSPRAIPTRLVVPAIARARGKNNSFFTTAISIRNTTAKTFTFRLRYLQDGAPEADAPFKDLTIEGKKTLSFKDIIYEAFGIDSEGNAGMLFVEGADVTRLIVSSETSTPLDPEDLSKGTSPSTLAAYAPDSDQAIGDPGGGLPSSVVSHPALEETTQFRTNLILAETAGVETKVRVRLTPKNSNGVPLAEKEYTLKPLQRLQINSFMKEIAGDGVEFVDVATDVEWDGGGGRVLAIATKIDNDPESKRNDIYVFGPTGTMQGSIGF